MIEVYFETGIVEVFRRVLVKNRFAFAFETAEQEATAVVVAHVEMTVEVVNDWRASRNAKRFEYDIMMFA